MSKPQTIEEAQQIIQDLEKKLSEASKNKKPKEPELLVEYETGNLQIRRLTGKSINLPTFVIRWILANAQQIIAFMATNKHLLAEQGDSEITAVERLTKRTENLASENPVVRKPRAKNETQEF